MTPAALLALLARGAAPGGTTTWDSATAGAGVTLSFGDRVLTVAGGTANTAVSTTTGSGKDYAEVTILGLNAWVGFVNSPTSSASSYVGSNNNGQGYASDGGLYVGGAVSDTYTAYGAGSIIGLALDTGLTKLWWSLNGVWQDGNPATGAGGRLYASGPIYLAASGQSGGGVLLNCGQDPFELEVPTGFSAWG